MQLTHRTPLWPLLCTFSWQELRHHPWRNAAAVVSVMLGVALAFSVHLINASALDEFSQAVRSVGGQPDLELRPANPQQGVPLDLWGRLQQVRGALAIEADVFINVIGHDHHVRMAVQHLCQSLVFIHRVTSPSGVAG